MSSTSPPVPCPRCGSTATVPIIYGYPGGDLMEAQQRGELVLGGCCISPGQPTHECRTCRRAFLA